MTIASTGEFGLIQRVTSRLGTATDDPARPGRRRGRWSSAPDRRVVACSDVLVEGRHFRCDWASATDIGHRAAAANLADIAAMGAVPTALLVALCIPPDLDPRWVEQLTDGLAAEAEAVGRRRGRRRHLGQPGDHDRGDRAGRPGRPGAGAALGRP